MLQPYAPRRLASHLPLFVVLNDGSGAHDGEATQAAIEAACARAGRRQRVFRIRDPQELDAAATLAATCASEHEGIVVAAGGDGTLNAVADAAITRGCAFGVLPRGTFNYFSRTHGIPQETDAALDLLLQGRAWPVQAGRVNGRLFLVNASLGLYPQLLEDREAWKAQYGRTRLVALASALATLLREHRQLRLQLETGQRRETLRTPTVFVGNNRLQLEQLGLKEADMLDGRLAALALRPIGTLAMLGLLLRGAFGRLAEADAVHAFAFREMEVSPFLGRRGRRVKVATDGEVGWMQMPLRFEVAAQPLWLVKPEPVDTAPSDAA